MLKFQTQKMLWSILLLAAMGFINIVFADNVTNGSDTKVAFNSLESFQINCFGVDSAAQPESDPEFIAKLVNLAASDNSQERISALSQLAVKRSIDPTIVQKILQTAVLDKDSNVRGQAVYAIAQQSCENLPLILEQAMHDSELSVRLMAVDSLGTDERSVALLEQAKNNEEEEAAIRELAAIKLESLLDTNKTQNDDI